MAKSKRLSRSVPVFTALVFARPAWASGFRPIDEEGPLVLYLVLLSLVCYVGHRLLLQHERQRLLLSLDDHEPSELPPNDRERFFPVIQVAVTFVAAILVSVGLLPAVLLATFPFAYALGRRKNWLGVGLLLAAVVTSFPFFLLSIFVLLSL